MFGTEFLIDGNALSLVASDANCNVYTFAYDRNNWQGQKLLTCAAFHLGAKVTKFVRRRPSPAAELVRRRLHPLIVLACRSQEAPSPAPEEFRAPWSPAPLPQCTGTCTLPRQRAKR